MASKKISEMDKIEYLDNEDILPMAHKNGSTYESRSIEGINLMGLPHRVLDKNDVEIDPSGDDALAYGTWGQNCILDWREETDTLTLYKEETGYNMAEEIVILFRGDNIPAVVCDMEIGEKPTDDAETGILSIQAGIAIWATIPASE